MPNLAFALCDVLHQLFGWGGVWPMSLCDRTGLSGLSKPCIINVPCTDEGPQPFSD